jgi:polar amino acid transport system substrate-binding protein
MLLSTGSVAQTATNHDANAAPEIVIMVEDASEPFSRSDGSGYANDLVRAAFKAAGVKVTLNVVPYARCREYLKKARVPACFAMSWSKDLENTGIVFAREPLFEVSADVYQNGVSKKIYRSGADIQRGATIGIINGYEYPDEVSDMEKAGVRLERNIDDNANLKMLAHHRLDAAIIMTSEFDNLSRRLKPGEGQDSVRFAFRSGIMKSFIAFNQKNIQGKLARDAFERGFSLIASNHEMDRIRLRWKSQTIR